MKFSRTTIATITGCALLVSPLVATAAPTSTTATTTPASTAASTTPTTTDSPVGTPQEEYTRLLNGIKADIASGNKRAAKIATESQKQIDNWGYNFAFQARQEGQDAAALIADASERIADVSPTINDHDVQVLKDVRAILNNAASRLTLAEKHIGDADYVHQTEADQQLNCPGAIDEGEDSGSSVGSSTAGLFNSSGPRIIYGENGAPTCGNNFQFYSGKLTKLLSTLTTIATVVVTLYRVYQAFTGKAPKKSEAASK